MIEAKYGQVGYEEEIKEELNGSRLVSWFEKGPRGCAVISQLHRGLPGLYAFGRGNTRALKMRRGQVIRGCKPCTAGLAMVQRIREE